METSESSLLDELADIVGDRFEARRRRGRAMLALLAAHETSRDLTWAGVDPSDDPCGVMVEARVGNHVVVRLTPPAEDGGTIDGELVVKLPDRPVALVCDRSGEDIAELFDALVLEAFRVESALGTVRTRRLAKRDHSAADELDEGVIVHRSHRGVTHLVRIEVDRLCCFVVRGFDDKQVLARAKRQIRRLLTRADVLARWAKGA